MPGSAWACHSMSAPNSGISRRGNNRSRRCPLLDTMAGDGFEAVGVNLGGGLPCRYQDAVADIAEYGAAIGRSLDRHLGRCFCGEILIEPGRYLVGDAGLIQTEVVLISRRSADDEMRWVYLDIGMFNGLTETLEEAIRYRIDVPGEVGTRRTGSPGRPLLRQRRYPL